MKRVYSSLLKLNSILATTRRETFYTVQAKIDPRKKTNLKRYVFHGLHGSMRAAQFELESFDQAPMLRDGEIWARVRSATICLSDIHTVCGTRKEPVPSVLGHEGCVEVVESRRHGLELSPGDRITFSIVDSCGNCPFCLNNLPQKCKSLFKYGHASTKNGSGFNGCYASHILIRAGTRVIKLPDQINDDLAATINCALATMINCVEQIPDRIKRDKNSMILIQGDGMLGLYGCVLLKELGIQRRFCSGNENVRFKLVESFGAIPISDVSKELKDETNRFDCVIEACGNSNAIPSGIRLLKPGGVYILVGMVHPNTNLDLTGEQIIRKCLTLKGVHNYHSRHLEQAVEFLRQTVHKYPYDNVLAPQKFSLDQFLEAIDYAKKKEYPRVCVRP